jgi:hypothetical protein
MNIKRTPNQRIYSCWIDEHIRRIIILKILVMRLFQNLILKPCPVWIDDCSLGFAYIAVSQNFDKVKWLIAVFMIEKLIYATHWTKWILITKLQMY